MDIRAGFCYSLLRKQQLFLPPDLNFSYLRTKDLTSCFTEVEGSFSVISSCIWCEAGLMYLLIEQLSQIK